MASTCSRCYYFPFQIPYVSALHCARTDLKQPVTAAKAGTQPKSAKEMPDVFQQVGIATVTCTPLLQEHHPLMPTRTRYSSGGRMWGHMFYTISLRFPVRLSSRHHSGSCPVTYPLQHCTCPGSVPANTHSNPHLRVCFQSIQTKTSLLALL